ncbi:hypothetical protein AYK24_04490 [Thermoplasmatales archaeon SG8-52-4]|nr:MAG: hypothetical protein AYK24_04490 [Thermoplasmatales archaeon SG8-52-4]
MVAGILKDIKIIGIICIFITATCIINVVATPNTTLTNIVQDIEKLGNRGTEYWALLVAVGVYADNPSQDRPLMLEEVDDLYETLIQSGIWTEDHIKVIKGKDATCSNIVAGFEWLDDQEDQDDFSIVFITTHGSPIDFDIPPFDEEDKKDEVLISYWGFEYPSLFIYDDQINRHLNNLESQGVCLIVDSCFAGGFNDPPYLIKTHNNLNQMSSEKFIKEFGGELSGQNRVVLMASREDELSYSGGFAPYVIDGLKGHADTNKDDIVTAEEVFVYCEPRCSRQHPTIFDGYPGELPLMYLNRQDINSENELQIVKENIRNYYPNISFSPENSFIKGFVKDANTDDPISNATIFVRGRDDEWDFFENYTSTDQFGFFSINVPACRCWVSVYTDGYCSDQSGFQEINESETYWLNFTLYPRPPENSIICGYIYDDETGDPIDGANISLLWLGDEYQFYFNDTNSEYDGFYLLNVAAGEIELEVEAVGYFRDELHEIFISDYETIWANFSLLSPPQEKSVICGYITDKISGDPINNIEIRFEWVDIVADISYQNETRTNSSGFYSLNIASGEVYHDIRNSNYDYYYPYRINAIENETNWMNVTLEEDTIEVEIVKPLRALYISNNRLIPFFRTRIIGSIDIEASIRGDFWGPSSAERVEFYVNGYLKETLTSEPYIFTWSDIKLGKQKIKVIAYDYEGNSDFDEIEVYKFL